MINTIYILEATLYKMKDNIGGSTTQVWWATPDSHLQNLEQETQNVRRTVNYASQCIELNADFGSSAHRIEKKSGTFYCVQCAQPNILSKQLCSMQHEPEAYKTLGRMSCQSKLLGFYSAMRTGGTVYYRKLYCICISACFIFA